MNQLVFGADGGGTKTLGLVSDLHGNILSRQTVGASNPNVVGFEAAAANIVGLLNAACAEAKCLPEDLSAIVLGLSGAGRADARTQLQQLIAQRTGMSLPVTIDTDARIGLEGAFEGAPGIVIIAGTGSVVIGKAAGGSTSMIGGWGRALGDEGSGFYLGLEALKSLRLYYDRRGGSEMLATAIASEFGLNSRERIIAAIYQEKFEFSTLAPVVIACAGNEDPVAVSILRAGAQELAEQTRVLAGGLGISGSVPVAFFGGLIESENIYSSVLRDTLARMLPESEVRKPAKSPAEGAIIMAIQLTKTSSA